MKISGFTMGRNVSKLAYPIKESIMSILPIVDEFVVALGEGDEDDNTRELIESIKSPKIKIIPTQWDLQKYPHGMENAHQTDIAKEACSGDWLFYLQADEVVHEKYLSTIKKRCEELLPDKHVEGLLFKYMHFWGDFDHYQQSHTWYDREIRIIRNDPDIHSWRSAQSFRRIPDFDGLNYRQKDGTYKLNVAEVDAYIFHYGWVRPPRLMKNKMKALSVIHKGEQQTRQKLSNKNFDYGPLNRLKVYRGTHPKVMKKWIMDFNWGDELQFSGAPSKNRKKYKHEKRKYRLLSWLENKLLGGKKMGGSKNYNLLKR